MKYLPPPYLKLPNPFLGPRNIKPMEIHVEDSCNAHSKIDRKILAVYGSNDVVQPKDSPFGRKNDE